MSLTNQTTQYCLNCFCDLWEVKSLNHFFFSHDVLCFDCRNKLVSRPVRIECEAFNIYSIYPYDDFFQRLLIQYKDLYDEALYPLFLRPYLKVIKYFIKDLDIVCIPSHESHISKRGFDHVPLLLSELNVPMHKPLRKISNRHQARSGYLNRKERLFELNASYFDYVLLVDDMCTTTESLKQAASLLSHAGATVTCFTIGYHSLLIKQFPYTRWRLKGFQKRMKLKF